VLTAVTEYGGVARRALHDVIRYPLDAVVSGCVGERPRTAAGLDGEPKIGSGDLPWISEAEPIVSHPDLPAIQDFLVENSELVSNTITDCWHLQRRQGFHETGGKPAQAACAQARLLFVLDHIVKADAKLSKRFPERVTASESK